MATPKSRRTNHKRGSSHIVPTTIGVTGIVFGDDVETMRLASKLAPETHTLMAGILVSGKTMAGEFTSNRRYPAVDTIPKLISELKEFSWPVIHYNTSGKEDPLQTQLSNLVTRFPGIGGIQLNIVRPDWMEMKAFHEIHPDIPLILQINKSSVGSMELSLTLEYLRRYGRTIGSAILDMSGGRGVGLDTDWTTNVLRWWPNSAIRASIAGGLGPDCGPILQKIHKSLDAPGLGIVSIDAESGVRVPVTDPIEGADYQDKLSPEKVLAYVGAVKLALT